MTPRASHLAAALLALAVPRLGWAESHKLLVLQSEGRASAATRAKIDAAIVKLARASEPQTAAGELDFTDAATAVGCKPEAASCKDEVLGMLAVDEIVTTTVTPGPGGLEIEVHRYARGGASRDARMLLVAGSPPSQLDGIAPLFGEPPAVASVPPPATSRTPAPPAIASHAPAPVEPPAPEPAPLPAPTAVPLDPAPPAPAVVASEPAQPPVDSPSSNRHVYDLAGMATGGGLIALGVVLWASASGVQGDITNAPTTTRADLVHLKDLESRGDAYAAFGNIAVVTGLVVGGVATYFYIRDRRTGSTATARLTPTVLGHGAGLVLTIGGTP